MCGGYVHRCEVPEGTEEQARLQLLVSWIIDHPDDLIDDEVWNGCGGGGGCKDARISVGSVKM